MAEEEAAAGEEAPLPPHQVHVPGVASPDPGPDLPGILIFVSQKNHRNLNKWKSQATFDL